uniref:Secreted protein n=1 Tax=Naja naja TaxID=35670 RepID=A0A8C6X5D3_NAJNA
MWLLFRRGSPRALMTLPKAKRLALIWMLSFSLSPVHPDFTTRSEPARSTKQLLLCLCAMVTVKTVWERLDLLLRWVLPVCLAVLPISSRLRTSSRPSTSVSFTPCSTKREATLLMY